MLRSGRGVSEVSTQLGVGENLLYKWRKESDEQLSHTDRELHTEVQRLRLHLKQVETERDILKKALLIFGRTT